MVTAYLQAPRKVLRGGDCTPHSSCMSRARWARASQAARAVPGKEASFHTGRCIPAQTPDGPSRGALLSRGDSACYREGAESSHWAERQGRTSQREAMEGSHVSSAQLWSRGDVRLYFAPVPLRTDGRRGVAGRRLMGGCSWDRHL